MLRLKLKAPVIASRLQMRKWAKCQEDLLLYKRLKEQFTYLQVLKYIHDSLH